MSTNQETWDYVVVGAGSAGCALAARLSEDASVSVLLLEAGADTRPAAVRIPALIQKIDSRMNWLYPVEPDTSRDGLVDPYSAGRAVGGSSAINAMMWVRGHPSDYTGWAAAGAEGWDWPDVLPAFRRSERFEDGADAYRGGDGPTRVVRTRVAHPLIDRFLAAAEQVGCEPLSDYNGPSMDGAGRSQVTQVRGLRQSAADAYLKPARRRPNLAVRAQAPARGILIEDGRATGVVHGGDDGERVVTARREVLVSCGALGSPKLLMLSGIGPGAALATLGIEVVCDLPGVGSGLQDHPATALVYEVRGRTLNQDVTPLRLIRHTLDFVARGRGALTSTSNHAVVFDRLDPAAPAPDAELIFMAFGLAAAGEEGGTAGGGRLRRLTARSGGRSEGRRQAAAEPLVTAQAAWLRPSSRGNVSLRSADPDDPPSITMPLLETLDDVAGLTGAARRVRAIFSAPALRSQVIRERVPGPATDDDAAWAEHLRATCFRLCHPACTCAMGSGERSVVDARLRVRGVQGLRVVDASVMPSITGGNTNAPVIMIAERAAELIRADRR